MLKSWSSSSWWNYYAYLLFEESAHRKFSFFKLRSQTDSVDPISQLIGFEFVHSLRISLKQIRIEYVSVVYV